MKRIKIFILILFIFLVPRVVFSQALRINYFGIQTCQTGNAARNLTFGFGYEQDIWTKISVSLEYNLGYTLSLLDENTYQFDVLDPSNPYQYSTYQYELSTPWHEFSYCAKYFFKENSDNSWYISTGIAYRFDKYKLLITNYNSTQSSVIPIGSLSNSITSVPISLKFGFRNNLEGIFGDYSFGFSYLASSDDLGSGNPLIDNALPADNLNPLFIYGTCTFGFGWAKGD